VFKGDLACFGKQGYYLVHFSFLVGNNKFEHVPHGPFFVLRQQFPEFVIIVGHDSCLTTKVSVFIESDHFGAPGEVLHILFDPGPYQIYPLFLRSLRVNEIKQDPFVRKRFGFFIFGENKIKENEMVKRRILDGVCILGLRYPAISVSGRWEQEFGRVSRYRLRFPHIFA
jgi:hypothetical protein